MYENITVSQYDFLESGFAEPYKNDLRWAFQTER